MATPVIHAFPSVPRSPLHIVRYIRGQTDSGRRTTPARSPRRARCFAWLSRQVERHFRSANSNAAVKTGGLMKNRWRVLRCTGRLSVSVSVLYMLNRDVNNHQWEQVMRRLSPRLMPLKYAPSLTLKTGVVLSLSFSPCGRILAIMNSKTEISFWDTSTGDCYHPTLTSGCQGSFASLWIDNRNFVCGLSDGSVGTCKVLGEGMISAAKSLLSHQEVKFDKKQVAESEVIALSYQPSVGRLAVGSPTTVRILFMGTSSWEHENRIPDPQLSRHSSVQVIALAWMPENEWELVVAYKFHGVSIWNISTLTALRTFNYGDVLCCGTLCSTSESFVAIDDKREVLLYHLSLGFRWPLPKLQGIFSVSSIHRNTGFIVGSCGKAQLVDIPLALITQVLRQDSWSVKEQVGATSAFQDESENDFMIATAIGDICTIWKTETVG